MEEFLGKWNELYSRTLLIADFYETFYILFHLQEGHRRVSCSTKG